MVVSYGCGYKCKGLRVSFPTRRRPSSDWKLNRVKMKRSLSVVTNGRRRWFGVGKVGVTKRRFLKERTNISESCIRKVKMKLD